MEMIQEGERALKNLEGDLLSDALEKVKRNVSECTSGEVGFRHGEDGCVGMDAGRWLWFFDRVNE